MPCGEDAPRQKALDDGVDWLRNNPPSPGDVDEPSFIFLAKLGGVPLRGKLTPAGKQKVLDEFDDSCAMTF